MNKNEQDVHLDHPERKPNILQQQGRLQAQHLEVQVESVPSTVRKVPDELVDALSWDQVKGNDL